MVTPPIRISVSLNESDLEDFYIHNSRKSLLMKMIVICALIVFFAQLIHILIDPEALYQNAWKWVLAIIALFFLMSYTNKVNARKEFKRNKRLHESHIYVISENTIHIKGGPFNTIFQWDKLYDMSESKKSFFIWLNKSSVQIIPKREMTADEIEWLKTVWLDKFKKRK